MKLLGKCLFFSKANYESKPEPLEKDRVTYHTMPNNSIS